jgi:hypothetical protein
VRLPRNHNSILLGSRGYCRSRRDVILMLHERDAWAWNSRSPPQALSPQWLQACVNLVGQRRPFFSCCVLDRIAAKTQTSYGTVLQICHIRGNRLRRCAS